MLNLIWVVRGLARQSSPCPNKVHLKRRFECLIHSLISMRVLKTLHIQVYHFKLQVAAAGGIQIPNVHVKSVVSLLLVTRQVQTFNSI